MTQACIYKPARNAMQSGRAKSNRWCLEFVSSDPRFIDPIMGWTGSADTRRQVRLWFTTQEDAESYASKHEIEYVVKLPNAAKTTLTPKSYAANFAYNRIDTYAQMHGEQ